MKESVFISFEGMEGVGKSTNIKFCADWLTKKNIPHIITREPGGTEIGEIIRKKLLKAKHKSRMLPMTELLLILAARYQHIEEVIEPALDEGKWVLCDRYIYSTMAYQGYGRGLDEDLIDFLSGQSETDFMPSLTLLFDAPLQVSKQRIAQRNAKTDRFETEDDLFFQRVRNGFLEIAERTKRVQLIDASRDIKLVQKDVLKHLKSLV